MLNGGFIVKSWFGDSLQVWRVGGCGCHHRRMRSRGSRSHSPACGPCTKRWARTCMRWCCRAQRFRFRPVEPTPPGQRIRQYPQYDGRESCNMKCVCFICISIPHAFQWSSSEVLSGWTYSDTGRAACMLNNRVKQNLHSGGPVLTWVSPVCFQGEHLLPKSQTEEIIFHSYSGANC